MNIQVYDFGIKPKGKKEYELKEIAWPIQAWQCLVPDNINPKLNIIEKLILKLIFSNVVHSQYEVKEILCNQLGLNNDLIENVFNTCIEKGYISKRDKELKLNQLGIDELDVVENGISDKTSFSDSMEKIVLFQDRVSKNIIPYFGLAQLPTVCEFIDESKVFMLDKSTIERPKTAAIANALIQWSKIYKRIQEGDTEELNRIDVMDSAIEDEKFFVEENEDYDKDNSENQTVSVRGKIDCVEILDDAPTVCFAKGYLGFNCLNPDEVEVFSPFGSEFDHWFSKSLNREIKLNDFVKQEISDFIEDKKVELKDKVAINNDLQITLFDEFPIICNDEKYGGLKKSIFDVARCVDHFSRGDDYTTDFERNMRVAVDLIFREVVKVHPELFAVRDIYNYDGGFFAYKNQINSLVANNRLPEDLAQKYRNRGIFDNMLSNSESNGGAKDYAALMLLYASVQRNNSIYSLVIDYPLIFIDIISLVQLGNGASHGKDGYHTIKFTYHQVQSLYTQYENIVRLLFENLIKE